MARIHFHDHQYYRVKFPSVAQSVAAGPAPKNRLRIARHYRNLDRDHRSKLGTGCDSVADVDRLVVEGWKAGADRMRAMAAKATATLPRLRRMKRKARRGRSGDELDIHAVNCGNLDRAWRRMDKVQSKRGRGATRRVRVVLDMGANCSRTAEERFLKPAAGLIAAERLIRAGYAVEVVAASVTSSPFANDSTNRPLLVEIRAKEFGQPLTLDNLAILALPGFYLKFDYMAHATVDGTISPNWGYARKIERHLDALSKHDAVTLVVPHMRSEAEIINWLDNLMTKDGVITI